MRYSIVQGPRQSFWNAYSGACRVFCLVASTSAACPPIYEDGAPGAGFRERARRRRREPAACSRIRAPTARPSTSAAAAPGRVAEFARIVAHAFGREFDAEAERRLPLRRHAPHRLRHLQACARSAGSRSARRQTASPSTSRGCARRRHRRHPRLAEKQMKAMGVVRAVAGDRHADAAADLVRRAAAPTSRPTTRARGLRRLVRDRQVRLRDRQGELRRRDLPELHAQGDPLGRRLDRARLCREAMRMAGVERGVEVTLLSDIPSEGSGLGSSSSFTVGLLNAFYAYRGEQVTAEQLAQRGLRDRDRAPWQADRQAGPVHRGLRRPAQLPLSGATATVDVKALSLLGASSCASSPRACTCSSPARRARRT